MHLIWCVYLLRLNFLLAQMEIEGVQFFGHFSSQRMKTFLSVLFVTESYAEIIRFSFEVFILLEDTIHYSRDHCD